MAQKQDFEKKGLRALSRIEDDLEAIKDKTGSPKTAFINGIIYGVRAFIGGILAIFLLGWFLAIAGLIPGFGQMAQNLRTQVDAVRPR